MASTGETWRLGRRPALDGLRGIAVLLVIASHAWDSRFITAGPIGVSIFFVLSGFLITALLLEEHTDTGRISLGAFYARRARRLLPALGFFLAVMLAAGVSLSPMFATPRQVIAAVLYAANWVTALGGQMGGLTHLWSLAVEEQFYLTFPIIAVALLHRGAIRALLWVTLLGVCLSLAARFVLWEGTGTRVYSGTDTNAYALLLGCALAIGLRLGLRPIRWSLAGSAAVIALLAMFTDLTTARLVAPMVAAFLAAGAIWTAVTRGAPTWLGARWLRWVGRRSYALYLWNLPLVGTVTWELHPPVWVRLLMVAATFGVVAVSWRYVEAPFLRARSRIGNEADRVEVNVGVVSGGDHDTTVRSHSDAAGDIARAEPVHLVGGAVAGG